MVMMVYLTDLLRITEKCFVKFTSQSVVAWTEVCGLSLGLDWFFGLISNFSVTLLSLENLMQMCT